MDDIADRPATLGQALDAARTRLAAAGIPDAAVDARVLAQAAFGGDRAHLLTHRHVAAPARALTALQAMVDRRTMGEPVSRILGQREFWSLRFQITPDTLDPRADTETVVRVALERLGDGDRPLTLLDLGTGTGCLMLALLSELPRARGIGVDRSLAAVSVARANAAALGLADRCAFLVGDWAGAVGASRVDVAVCNPPYVPSGSIAGLQREVAQFDPRSALDGGPDGLAAYRRLVPDLWNVLRPDGWAAFEVGIGQARSVERLMKSGGFNNLRKTLDLSGTLRCVSGQKTVGLPED